MTAPTGDFDRLCMSFNRLQSQFFGKRFFLSSVLSAFKNIFSSKPSSFDANVVRARYQEQTLKKLKQLFAVIAKKTQQEQIEQLQEFLKNHNELVRASTLDYTAFGAPDELRSFIFSIAEYVAKKTQKTPLEVLVPSLARSAEESLTNPLESPFSLNLKNWKIESTPAGPDLEQSYSFTQPDKSLAKIFASHTFNDARTMLVPVAALLAVYDPSGCHEVINPYWDLDPDNKEKEKPLSLAEIDRLRNHSNTARAFVAAWKEYKEMQKESPCLYDQLWVLCQNLKANNAYSGLGSHEDAARGAYPAIIAFNEYYALLSEEQKKDIPLELKGEIQFFINLASPSSEETEEQRKEENKGRNHKSNIDTCIANRGSKISTELNTHAEVLKKIKVSEGQKKSRAEALGEAFTKNRELFYQELVSNRYEGKEQLGLTPPLVQTLNCTLDIRNNEELNQFLHCSPENIRAFLKAAPGLAKKIAKLIKTPELFYFYFLEHSEEKWQILFEEEAFLFQLCKQDVFTKNALTALINIPVIYQNKERVRVLLCIEEKIPGLILQEDGWAKSIKFPLIKMLKALDGAQCKDFLAKRFPNKSNELFSCHVKNIKNLVEMLAELDEEQGTALLDAIDSKMVRSQIETISCSRQLGPILASLPAKNITARVLSEVQGKFKDKICTNFFELREILKNLPAAKCTMVLEHWADKIKAMPFIQTELSTLFYSLNSEQTEVFFNFIVDRLVDTDTIKNGFGLRLILTQLPRQSCESLLTQLKTKNKLATFFEGYFNVLFSLGDLDTERRATLFAVIADNLDDYIDWNEIYIKDFSTLLRNWHSEEQRIAILSRFVEKGVFSASQMTFDSFVEILSCLTETQIALFLSNENMATYLRNVVTVPALQKMLKDLAVEQVRAVLKTIKKQVAQIIPNYSEFFKFKSVFDADRKYEKYEVVFELLADQLSQDPLGPGYHLPVIMPLFNEHNNAVLLRHAQDAKQECFALNKVIGSWDQLASTCAILTAGSCSALVSAMRPYLADLNLERLGDFIAVFRFVGVVERQVIFTTVKEKLCSSPLTWLPFILMTFLRYVLEDAALAKEVLPEITAQLFALIGNQENLEAVLRFLSVEQGSILLNFMQERGMLIKWIPNWKNFRDMLGRFKTKEWRKALFTVMKPNLHQLERPSGRALKSNCSFCAVFEYLDSEQKDELVALIEGHPEDYIIEPEQLNKLLSNLTEQQCQRVLSALKGRLPRIIPNLGVLSSVFGLHTNPTSLLVHQKAVFSAVMAWVVPTMQGPSELSLAVQLASSEECERLFTEDKNHWTQQIKCDYDVKRFFQGLDGAKSDLAFTLLKEDLIKPVIKSADSLLLVLGVLSQQSSKSLLDALGGNLVILGKTLRLSRRNFPTLEEEKMLCRALFTHIEKIVKIYEALYAGTTKGFFQSKERIIYPYAEVFCTVSNFYNRLSNSPMLANALNIYTSNLDAPTLQSPKIMQSIHQKAYEGSGFFRRSKLKNTTVATLETFSEAPEGTRRHAIWAALGG